MHGKGTVIVITSDLLINRLHVLFTKVPFIPYNIEKKAIVLLKPVKVANILLRNQNLK